MQAVGIVDEHQRYCWISRTSPQTSRTARAQFPQQRG